MMVTCVIGHKLHSHMTEEKNIKGSRIGNII